MANLMLETMTRAKSNDAVIVTGSTRGGTTIMGKLLHSMEGVEYVNEPPTLCSLIPLIGQINREAWKLLYETYLFEEILFNSLAGRALNCNTADESSIYQVKDKAWIHQRLSRTLRKFDAEAEIERSIIAYKVVGVASFIPEIQAFYPKTRVVIILRPPNDVFHSIVARQYFTNETLRRRNAAWPHRIVNGLRIPFLVKQSDEEFWLKSDEIHRAAYFYIRSYDGLEQIRNRVLVRYEEMVRNPEKFTRALAEILGMSWGSGTPSLIGQVKKMEKDRSQDYLKQLSGQMKEEVLRYATLAQEEACLTGVG